MLARMRSHLALAWISALLVLGCGRVGYDERECPAGMVLVVEAGPAPFCIESAQSVSYQAWTDAEAACTARGRRLCWEQEWEAACVAVGDQLDGMLDDWEWTAERLGGPQARKRGGDTCEGLSMGEVTTGLRYRCCTDR